MDGKTLFVSDPVYAALVCFFVIVFGLLLGSFSSAVSYRMMRGESWIFSGRNSGQRSGRHGAARSSCPYCRHQLGFRDLIPVVSWMLSRGRCRYCGKHVSALYPALEIFSAAIFLSYYIGAGFRHDLWQNILFAVCLPFALALLAAFYKKSCPVPLSLWIVGLLSLAGMVLSVLI